MGIFTKTLTENDLATNRIGKLRSYRLSRGDLMTSFRGRLLSFYREGMEPEVRNKFVSSYIDTIAIFRTDKDKYVVYYILQYVGNDYEQGQRAFLNSAESMDHIETFLSKMNYQNVKSFASIILSEARRMDGPAH